MMLNNYLNKIGKNTPDAVQIYRAIYSGDTTALGYLLSTKKITNYSDIVIHLNPEQLSPLALSVSHYESEILILLISYLKNTIPNNEINHVFIEVVRHQQINHVQALIIMCSEMISDYHAFYGLRIAAENGNLTIATLILSEFSSKIDDNQKGNVLLMAAKQGHIAIVKSILNLFSNTIHNHSKGSALISAAENGHYFVIKYLINHEINNIYQTYKSSALEAAIKKGNSNIVKLLLSNLSIYQLAGYEDNAALKLAQNHYHFTQPGSHARNQYRLIINQLMSIPSVAHQYRLDNSLNDIIQFNDNSMSALTQSENATVKNLKKNYGDLYYDKGWEVIKNEILNKFKYLYSLKPALGGYQRIWMLPDSKIPTEFIAKDTIGIQPINEHYSNISWYDFEGNLETLKVKLSDIKSVYFTLKKMHWLNQEAQDIELISAIINKFNIPHHPHQNKPLPLEYSPLYCLEIAYYRHNVHNAIRYLSDTNPWLSANAAYAHHAPEGSQAIISDESKELISLIWLAINDPSIKLLPGFTHDENLIIFAETLKEINRGHNSDEHSYYKNETHPSRKMCVNDNLGADQPSCSYGISKRLLQNEFGHPYLALAESRDLDLEILRLRIEEFLIRHKGSENDYDTVLDRSCNLSINQINYICQKLDKILMLNEYDDEEITLTDAEANEINFVLIPHPNQIKKFIKHTEQWFGKDRINAYQYDELPSTITAPSLYKGHHSFSNFIYYCLENPLHAFSEILWKTLVIMRDEKLKRNNNKNKI